MSKLLTETRDKLFIVTINRPEARNSIDRETAALLVDAFERFEADENLLIAILTGAGGHFCAGADLKSIGDPARSPVVRSEGYAPLGVTRMLLSKPTIAAVEGYAVAGGLELALWCDLRVSAENATFGVFCRRWGVPLVDGGTIRLPRLIGHSHALDMILTGRAVQGTEAKQIGLANRLAPEGQTLSAAIELAQSLTQFPQICMRSDRLSSYEQWGRPLSEALRNETQHGLKVLASGETVRGAARFASGRGRHGSMTDL